MKDDAYKSLCQACFEQKAQFFLGCRCIFCKNCISLWQSKAKPLENNQVDLVTCGFCGKNTDPKINNLLDMKSAQQFAFLFAEPETLFQRQIEIIQFQRGQSMKYISYLQSRVKQTDSQLSLIYTHCPEIKQKILAIQDEQQGRYRQQPGSCINFKNESRNQKEEEMNRAQMRNNNQMEYETSPFQDNNRQVIKNQVFQQQQQQQLQQRGAPQNQPYPVQYQNYQPQQQQNQQPLQSQQAKLMIQQPDLGYQQQGYLQQQPQKFQPQPQQQQEQLSSFPAQNLASKNTSNNSINQANAFSSSQMKVKSIVNLNNPNNTSKDMYLTPMITGDKRNRTATTQASSNQSGRSIQNNNINKTMNFNNNPVGVVYPIVENGSNSRGDSISSRQQQIKEHVNSAFATAYTTKPLQQSIQPSLDYSRQSRRL